MYSLEQRRDSRLNQGWIFHTREGENMKVELTPEKVAALLLLSSGLDMEDLCGIVEQAVSELCQIGLIEFKSGVEETETYIIISNDYYKLTERGKRVREKLLRRLRK